MDTQRIIESSLIGFSFFPNKNFCCYWRRQYVDQTPEIITQNLFRDESVFLNVHCKCKCRINVVTPLYKIVYLMWRFNIHEITFIRHFGCCSKCLLNIPLLALASMLIKHYLDPINSKMFIGNSKTFIGNFFTSNTRFCIMVWQRLFYIYIYSVVTH